MIALLVCLAIAGFEESGTIFLALPTGGKAVGMGSAFTALADDATCAYYNPAGLAFADAAEVAVVNSAIPGGAGLLGLEVLRDLAEIRLDMPHDLNPDWQPRLYPDMRFTYSGAVIPIHKHGSLGISYAYLCTGTAAASDPYGNPIGEWEPYDYAVALSYGRSIFEILGLGCSAKYVHSFMVPEWVLKELGYEGGGSGGTIALDLGVLIRTPVAIPGLSFGASYQNMGGKIEMGGSHIPLPRMVRLGIAVEPTATLDVVAARYGFPQISRYIRYTHTLEKMSDLVGSSHESYHSQGNEITLLNTVSYRWGTSEGINGRDGRTHGYAVRLGFLDFGVAEDNDICPDSWRVQLDFSPLRTTQLARIRSDPELDAGFMLFSSLLFPGGGQLYEGEALKGLALVSAAFFFSEWDYREGGAGPKIGLSAVYAVSILDAIRTVSKKQKTNS